MSRKKPFHILIDQNVSIEIQIVNILQHFQPTNQVRCIRSDRDCDMVHTIIVISWLQPDVGERVLMHEMPRSSFACMLAKSLPDLKAFNISPNASNRTDFASLTARMTSFSYDEFSITPICFGNLTNCIS